MDKRVQFDFVIEFTNGGGVQGQGFRLDIEGDDISDQELADAIVKDMRLLMVGRVSISNKQILTEPHKRAITQPLAPTAPRYVDLSHTIESGLITYKGLPAPLICDYLSREESRKQYAPGTTFQIGKIEMVTNTGTYLDCPFHRYEDGKDLSQVGVERLADLEGIVVRADYHTQMALDASFFRDKELRGRAVLVHTGWDAQRKSTKRKRISTCGACPRLLARRSKKQQAECDASHATVPGLFDGAFSCGKQASEGKPQHVLSSFFLLPVLKLKVLGAKTESTSISFTFARDMWEVDESFALLWF
ncbi:hypothetical protein KDH_71980 [Dictyobacter sp. S3.2.2.5]|uniref:Cyclase n=1 Tax=Dictyobacter halimunensis TaxID=3026934 RepID=A0ABQ6G1H9_9CHLR|nr:hypothetical protein KDH_71980 [Dictyobacter sp. S3.2.2.5]